MLAFMMVRTFFKTLLHWVIFLVMRVAELFWESDSYMICTVDFCQKN